MDYSEERAARCPDECPICGNGWQHLAHIHGKEDHFQCTRCGLVSPDGVLVRPKRNRDWRLSRAPDDEKPQA